MALTIGLPVGHPLARLAPVGARRCDHRTACRPLTCHDAAPLAFPCRHAQRLGPGVITRRGLRLAPRLGRREIIAAAIIDGRDPAVAIAIAVIGIAHEIRIVGAGLVIIIAIAVVDRLRIGQVIAAGFPDPGLDTVIIEIIIGRRVADRVADPVGPVDPRITIVIGRFGIAKRSSGRQGGCAGGVTDRRRRARRQRLDLRQWGQSGKRLRLRIRRLVDARLTILLATGGKREGQRGGAGEPERDLCLSGHGE